MFYSPAPVETVYGDSCIATDTSGLSFDDVSWIVKALQSAIFDPNSNFNAGLSRYVVPEDGTYRVIAYTGCDTIPSGRYWEMTLAKNGVAVDTVARRGYSAISEVHYTALVTSELSLSKDDYLQIFVRQPQSLTVALDYGIAWTGLIVIRLT